MECTLEREKAAQHAEAAADELARALAFVGNSSLAPMSQTSDAALDRAFWAAFPDFGSEEAACALDGLFAWRPRARTCRAPSACALSRWSTRACSSGRRSRRWRRGSPSTCRRA